MEGNLLNDPTMRMLYNDALLDLMAGSVNFIDKEVLSYTPLPDSVIDPYVSQEVQAKAAMELTFSSLSTWIEEAKKASYFTKHFVVLSKMINNGVASMARGLATLHACGEELSRAPMSIQDLISVASYHIRKSYLGVIQTSRSHPEIGEQLVLNQLSWTNTLLRLYKTKEKLAKPVCKVNKDSGVRIQGSGNESQILPAPQKKCGGLDALPALSEPGGPDELQSLSGSCELNELTALPEPGGLGELPALAEPGGYGPARAFAPYSADSRQRSADSSQQLAGRRQQTADQIEIRNDSETGEIRNQKSETRNDSEADGKIEIRKNEKAEIADGNEKPEEESTDGNYKITENEKSEKEIEEKKERPEAESEDENDDFSEDDFFDEEDFLNPDWFDPHYKAIPIPVRNISKNHNSPDTS